MKPTALLLPALATARVVPLEARQFDFSSLAKGFQSGAASGNLAGLAAQFGPMTGTMANMFMQKKAAHKIIEITPSTGIEGAKRIKILYGPYRLRGTNTTEKVGNSFSMDRGGTGYMHLVDSDFPKDITLLEVHSQIQNPDGTRAATQEGIYNHHNLFAELRAPGAAYGCENGKTDLFGSMPMNVFAAGATEDGTIQYFAHDQKVKSGFYIPRDRTIINMVDTINYNAEDREVFTATEMEYLEGRPQGYLRASQQRIDPAICGGPSGAQIHPPKGVSKFSVKSNGVVAMKDGWIVNARGHMHDGGVNIILKINDDVVCDSRAVYGGEGHTAKGPDGKLWETIRESSYCTKTIPVKKGDRVYMQADYDVSLHPSREMGGGHGGMAMRTVSEAAGMLDGGAEAEQMALMITHFAFAD